MKYLDKIESPADIKSLNEEELACLAEEIREVLVKTVSQTGGHLASNLGVRHPKQFCLLGNQKHSGERWLARLHQD